MLGPMTSRPRRVAHATNPYLPLLVLLFFASGCAALIYQVVWLQILQLVVGSSAISLGVLLAAFMGGMCLGSFLLPRVLAARHHPLKVYAALELGIGAAGLVLLYGVPLIAALYTALGGSVAVRALVASVCLLPPTVMMGATLPAIARWVEATPSGVSWLGFFYGGNIGGAVVGTLLAGFYLLRVFDVAVATFVAVGLNIAVGLAAWSLAKRHAYEDAASPATANASAGDATRSRVVLVAITLSGFTALVSEVIWTRLLSLAVGATVYAFSLILAAFLLGLGIGSSVGAALARHSRRPRALFGWCQMLLGGAIAWGAYMLTESIPYAPLTPATSEWSSFQIEIWRCLSVVLPGAILWGASFPLALAASAAQGRDPGRLVGGVYAANTAGAIAGSIGGVLMAAQIGSQHAQQTAILVSAFSAAILLAPDVIANGARGRLARGVGLAGALAAAVLLAWRVESVPGVLIAYGRNSASWADVTNIIYAGEGLNAFVAVSRTASGAPVYHAAGKVQASGEGEDLRLQRMLAHLSHLVPNDPKDVLVIGLGSGATAGALAIAPGVERMTVVEIERLVPPLSRYFANYNYNVAENPKVTVQIDDGRHFLTTSRQRFDVITSDLVDPWVKGTAALFTREFFESMKAHLKPGGVVTMFVQLYLSNTETVKSEIATFMEVFPHAIVWGNTIEGRGYDLVLTGQVEPSAIDIDGLQARLDRPDHAQVAQSLRDIGFGSAVELLSSYAGSRQDLAAWLNGAVINRDRNLRLQYLAGSSADEQQSGPIYAEMVRHARFPGHLFRGSPASLHAVMQGIERSLERAASGLQGARP
jgi:spermidine synthase